MYLGVYHFDGDPAALTTGYDRLRAQLAGVIELNVCVVRPGGISVYDACPTRADFEGFSGSPEIAGAFTGAGLPTPRIEQLGEIHAVLAGISGRSDAVGGPTQPAR